MSKQLLLFDPRVPPCVRRLCDRIDPEKRLGAAVVWFGIRKGDKNIYLPASVGSPWTLPRSWE
jgi:hypothetical protein